MSWSEKYKRSIDCNNPKGFSQRAHCQGRKKSVNEDVPVNAVGGGQVAGLGVNNPAIPNQAEPGVNKKKRKALQPFMTFIRRKKNV